LYSTYTTGGIGLGAGVLLSTFSKIAPKFVAWVSVVKEKYLPILIQIFPMKSEHLMHQGFLLFQHPKRDSWSQSDSI